MTVTLQIPISVAQGSLSAGDSPEQMWTDQNRLVEFFTKFLSATGTLNLIQARRVRVEWNSPEDLA